MAFVLLLMMFLVFILFMGGGKTIFDHTVDAYDRNTPKGGWIKAIRDYFDGK